MVLFISLILTVNIQVANLRPPDPTTFQTVLGMRVDLVIIKWWKSLSQIGGGGVAALKVAGFKGELDACCLAELSMHATYYFTGMSKRTSRKDA